MTAVLRLADKAGEVAIVTLNNCVQSVFGYPNDEGCGYRRPVAGGRSWPQKVSASHCSYLLRGHLQERTRPW